MGKEAVVSPLLFTFFRNDNRYRNKFVATTIVISPFAALFVDLACSHSFDVLSINEIVDVPFPMHA